MGEPTSRAPSWKWWVCGVLLLATMIMYMDRQTLANVSVRVTNELMLTNEQYGDIEFLFGMAFGLGSLIFGFLADKVSIRWLYPTALVGWSAAGVLTGFSSTYEELLACRIMLGLFEAGNWPCALITIQRLLSREDRGMGNSVLQSGGAIGSILTPLVVLSLMRWADPGEPIRLAQFAGNGGLAVAAIGTPPSVWRLPFFVIGAAGIIWVLLWPFIVRRGDLDRPAEADGSPAASVSLWESVFDRRFFALLFMVTLINGTWQLVRAWLPKFLQQGRGYSESEAQFFNSAYYIAADVGCLLAGATMLRLNRRGWDAHHSRMLVFLVCASFTALTFVAANLPAGWPLLGVLILIAAGSLGLFPCYYSLTQELSTAHMGKVSGLLGAFGWFVSSPTQKLFGILVDKTSSYDLPFAITGLPPFIAGVVLLLMWRGK